MAVLLALARPSRPLVPLGRTRSAVLDIDLADSSGLLATRSRPAPCGLRALAARPLSSGGPGSRKGGSMVVLKSRRDIAALREAGAVVGRALQAMTAAADVGVTTVELDEVARDVLREHGATSAFLGYQPHFASTPFPGVICASPNDVVVHGIPDDQPLADGDLLSIDFGAMLDGWAGDAAVTIAIGQARTEDLALKQHAEEALAAAIAAAQPGNRMGDIGAAIGAIGRGNGYGIPEGWGGHGVGRHMHESPSVPNEGIPGRGLRLKPGLVIAIEPMFMAGGSDEVRLGADGWAIHTADGSRAAHVEHTIAITDDGPQILTLP